MRIPRLPNLTKNDFIVICVLVALMLVFNFAMLLYTNYFNCKYFVPRQMSSMFMCTVKGPRPGL